MNFRLLLPAFAALVSFSPAMSAEAAKPAAPHCLNPAETREALSQSKFADPAAALRSAAAVAHADPLRSRLCRLKDDFVYEITLLRRDGKVMRVLIKAEDGSLVDGRI